MMRAALAFVSVSLISCGLFGPPASGPLQAGQGFHVSMPAADGEVMRWDPGLPFNRTDTDIHLRAIELVGVNGLDVVGIVLSTPTLRPDGTCLSAGNVPGFPPPGTNTDRIEGALLVGESRRTCTNYPQISVGLRRPVGTATGRVDAVRLRYDQEGRAYELLMPTSIEVHRP